MRLLGESTARMAPALLMLTAYKAKQHPAAAVPALLALNRACWGRGGHPCTVLRRPRAMRWAMPEQFLLAVAGSTVRAQPVMRWLLSQCPHTQPALHLLVSITPWRTTCEQCQKRSASARQGVQPCAVPRVLLTVPVAARVCPSASCSSLTSPGAHKVCSADSSFSTPMLLATPGSPLSTATPAPSHLHSLPCALPM